MSMVEKEAQVFVAGALEHIGSVQADEVLSELERGLDLLEKERGSTLYVLPPGYKWCETCKQFVPPEDFIPARSCCETCEERFERDRYDHYYEEL
ncbi:hypothetical protein N9878_00390 [bacterium]|nr:hypothetical protein [bacterium]